MLLGPERLGATLAPPARPSIVDTLPEARPTPAAIVAALLTEPTLEGAAGALGLSIPLLIALVRAGPVADALRDAQRAQAAVEAARRGSYASIALDALAGILVDPEASAASRVAAAAQLVAVHERATDRAVLEDRVAALESALAAAQSR
jgi:hypothetical protein